MIANLLKAGQKGQDEAAPLDALDLRRIQSFRQLRHRLLIERGLAAAQRAEGGDLGLVRQIADDALVGLEPAQDVGSHQAAQRGEVALVLRRAALHKGGKVFGATHETGAKKVKKRPQIRQPVFDRGAAEGDTVTAGQFLDRPALPRAGVLDRLGFVKNNEVAGPLWVQVPGRRPTFARRATAWQAGMWLIGNSRPARLKIEQPWGCKSPHADQPSLPLRLAGQFGMSTRQASRPCPKNCRVARTSGETGESDHQFPGSLVAGWSVDLA